MEKEARELGILNKYLPEQLSPEEIADAVKRIITETGAKGKPDFGKVMKLAMAELGGKADGKLVGQIASTQLGS